MSTTPDSLSSSDSILDPGSSPGSASRTPGRGMWSAVALMFVLSGAASLMYQVIWTRQLTTFFGSTLYGVATVLSSFMAGLALGSWLIGKRSDKMPRPLFAYGVIELGIGAAALLFPFALKAVQPLIGAVYATGGEGTFLLFSLIRFVVVFLLLLVPTTLMGATLPILGRAVTPDLNRVGRRVGGLYAINTLGAVLGVFATGFFLLEAIGVNRTMHLAALLNGLVGLLAMVLGRGWIVDTDDSGDPEPPAADAGLTPAAVRTVLATYCASGFIALAYEVCWTRAMIFGFENLKSTTYSFSGMLAVYLLGIAAGSALMQAFVDKQKDLLRLYALLQMGIGISAGLSFFVLLGDWSNLREVNEDGALLYWNAVWNVMSRTAATIGLPTLLMGMAFPVVARIATGSLRHLGSDVGRVYALNTLGAIAGSFGAGFVLIPVLGITGTLAALAAANLLLAAAIWWSHPRMAPGLRAAWAAGCAVAAVIVFGRIATVKEPLQRLQTDDKMVHYEEGAMATISVVENVYGDRTIYVDDVGVAGTDKVLLTDQKSLAHVPMMLLGGEAERTLSVGFGSGGASFSYTLYPKIKEIHTIEIAPEVLRAAPVLAASNHGIIAPEAMLARASAAGAERITGFRNPNADYKYEPLPGYKTFDPRFRVLMDDARSYLRFTKLKYDVIATDCTDLRYKSNANLYDLEYFQLCREAISDRGLVVVWMPLAGLSDRAFRCALRTFQEVFPRMSVWYFTNQPTHYCLLIGAKDGFAIDYEAVRRGTEIPSVMKDLDEIGLRDPDKLISSFVCDERTLKQHLADAPLNTEDNPVLEFESPRYGYDSRPLRDNQAKLYRIQTKAAPLLMNTPPEADPGARIWRFQQANEIAFRGHSYYREYKFEEACRAYQEAQRMAPDDASIARLMEFEELARLIDSTAENPNLNSLWVAHSYGRVMLLQGRYSDAVTRVAPILEKVRAEAAAPTRRESLREVAFALQSLLVEAYARAGRADRAREMLQQARGLAKSPEEADKLRSRLETEFVADKS